MQNPLDMREKLVVVTGGTRGVGAGIARGFLEAGAQVAVIGRSAPEQLPAHAGHEATFWPCDVRVFDQLETCFNAIMARYARLDVLVNNAGGAPPALAAEASPRFSESIVRLNLLAPLNCAQLANRTMQTQEHGGCIINIASVSAIRPSPGTAAYGAAKAGLVNLCGSLAIEWAPKVRVVAVIAGLVETEQAHLHYGDAEGVAAVGRTIPLARMATVADIANTCLYLASPLASYVSGTAVTVHGGGEAPAFLGAANVG